MKVLDFDFSQAVINKYGKKLGLDLLNSLWGQTVAGKAQEGSISIYKGSEEYTNYLRNLQKL